MGSYYTSQVVSRIFFHQWPFHGLKPGVSMVIVRISSGEVLGLFSYGEIKSGWVARWKKRSSLFFLGGEVNISVKVAQLKYIHSGGLQLGEVVFRKNVYTQYIVPWQWNETSFQNMRFFLVRILNIRSSCSNFAARNLREKQQMTLANQTGDESSSNDAWKETHAFRHWVTRGSDGLDGGVFGEDHGEHWEKTGGGGVTFPPANMLGVFQMAPKTLGDLVAVPGDFFAGRFGVEGVAILCRKQLPPEAFDRREINFTTVPTKISSTFCS